MSQALFLLLMYYSCVPMSEYDIILQLLCINQIDLFRRLYYEYTYKPQCLADHRLRREENRGTTCRTTPERTRKYVKYSTIKTFKIKPFDEKKNPVDHNCVINTQNSYSKCNNRVVFQSSLIHKKFRY